VRDLFGLGDVPDVVFAPDALNGFGFETSTAFRADPFSPSALDATGHSHGIHPSTVPCSGRVELNVDVDDIDQRDEFVFDAGGVRVKRVVWTILVSFNSDQLAVQPLVEGKRGEYTRCT